MANPNLRDLPEELVSNISLRLWSDDIHSLRLTCKALEQKILHDWATEYFSEKCFPIATDSLKVLLYIANSEKLRGFLRNIHIITSYFSESAFKPCSKTCIYGHGCSAWQPTIRQREAWKFFCEDQKDLHTSGRDREMLTEAFGKLPALSGISFVDSTCAVPQDCDIRMLRKVARLCGRNAMHPNASRQDSVEYHKVLTHTWSIVTSAIARSGRSTVTDFGSSLTKGGNGLCIPTDIRWSDAKIALLQKSLKSVENLRLQVTTRATPNTSGASKLPVVKSAAYRIQHFARLFQGLRSLTLDFDGLVTDSVIFSTFMGSLELSTLKTLQLHTLSMERKPLMAIFERLSSIKALFLSFINLTKGSWIPILKQLATMVEHLEHLHLMYLLEADKKVYFLKQLEEDQDLGDDDQILFPDLMMHGAENEFDYEDDSNDSDLPPIESMESDLADMEPVFQNGTAPLQATVEDDRASPITSVNVNAPQTSRTSASTGPSPANTAGKTQNPNEFPPAQEDHANDDYRAPGNEDYPERGYYVCLRGKEKIVTQLKIFEREYNIGEDVQSFDPPGVGGMPLGGGVMAVPTPPGVGPPNMNNILGGLAGYLGLPPMPGQGGGAGAGAGGQGGGNQQQSAAHTSHAGSASGAGSGANQTHIAHGSADPWGQATGGAAPPHMPMSLDGFLDGYITHALEHPGPGLAGAGADDGWDTEEPSEDEET